ncbi:thermonuclease family protein [Methanobrevibacter sp. TMH8]|uniref:thermonuclease family protein n=1 Tax=Methanobrevibacter sp. TMH8 TaxID=2848611 RepID=UPI001CCF17EA|nr:thermonuclease family protein [Methanobrevibacter sp. TMH8]MBZ9570681.1 thermonuclease family protein [Methanobrevibacter sp. TMH8]
MKERNKRIIMIVFLVFALFAVGGKLLTSVDDNSSLSNSNSKNSQSQYTNQNYSEKHPGINITTENYKQYYEVKGFCDRVVDGDTIDVSGVGRIRLVGIDTPEREQSGYENATDFVKSKCLGKTVYLDIDDAKNKDKYGRILAIVYVDGYNINAELLKRGYAQILFIPPSEFDPNQWT